jgi:Papain family cysteine protease
MRNFTGDPNTGCSGGRPEWVWQYSQEQTGIVAEPSHTLYNANSNAACIAKPRDVRSEVDYWVQIPSGNEEYMKCIVALKGPISVSISVERTSLQTYKSGIWDVSFP